MRGRGGKRGWDRGGIGSSWREGMGAGDFFLFFLDYFFHFGLVSDFCRSARALADISFHSDLVAARTMSQTRKARNKIAPVRMSRKETSVAIGKGGAGTYLNGGDRGFCMTIIDAYAPGKTILFGEHYVVYGASGIVCAIQPYNHLQLSAKPVMAGESPRLHYKTTLGTLQLQGAADGQSIEEVKGPSELQPQVAVYGRLLGAQPELRKLAVNAELKSVWPLKGVGNSASLGALMGAGLRSLIGAPSTPAQLMDDANAADGIAHGGKPSGIDASAVAHGGALLFKKKFKKDGTAEGKATPLSITMPPGWSFLVIDTLDENERAAATADQIATFARVNGIKKKPGEMSEKERQKICQPYAPIYEHALSALRKKDMKKLGAAMDACQELLAKSEVSTPRIDEAVAWVHDAGAAGAKLSGAGGTGGIVLALMQEKDLGKAKRFLSEMRFRSFEFTLAPKGAHSIKR